MDADNAGEFLPVESNRDGRRTVACDGYHAVLHLADIRVPDSVCNVGNMLTLRVIEVPVISASPKLQRIITWVLLSPTVAVTVVLPPPMAVTSPV